MNNCLIASLVIGSALALAPAPNTRAPGAQNKLTRLAPQALDPADVAQSAETWRERLRDVDLERREAAFDRLLLAAQREAALRDALEAWAQDGRDPELAWTARLARRELRAPPATPFGGFFGADPFFADARSMFEQLRRGFDAAAPLGLEPAPTPQSDVDLQSESLSFRMGPDGVDCTVTKVVDGQDVTEEYHAATLEELLQAHPELRGRIGLQPANPPANPGGAPDAGLRLRLVDPGLDPFEFFGAGVPAPGAQVRTDLLGVYTQPSSDAERKALGLAPGVGLRIERVEPGTIAQALGLQRGQVLTEINGTPIRQRDDITLEIQKRGADGDLELEFVDRWGQVRTRVWKPDTAARAKKI